MHRSCAEHGCLSASSLAQSIRSCRHRADISCVAMIFARTRASETDKLIRNRFVSANCTMHAVQYAVSHAVFAIAFCIDSTLQRTAPGTSRMSLSLHAVVQAAGCRRKLSMRSSVQLSRLVSATGDFHCRPSLFRALRACSPTASSVPAATSMVAQHLEGFKQSTSPDVALMAEGSRNWARTPGAGPGLALKQLCRTQGSWEHTNSRKQANSEGLALR